MDITTWIYIFGILIILLGLIVMIDKINSKIKDMEKSLKKIKRKVKK